MTPVIIGDATLLNGDCMEYMRGLPDNAFELAIVDPPYGIGMDGGKFGIDGCAEAQTYAQGTWDKSAPSAEYFLELSRVSKNQIIWGANHFADRLPKASSPCWIVWDKEKVGGFFADSELAYTSFKSAVRNFRFQWHGMLQGDMAHKEQRIHPTQKPAKLYEWLLTNYAKPGDRILDTHGGSMSSVIACLNLGFAVTCCELDADYFAKSCERVRNTQRQQTMFAPEPMKQIQEVLV